MATDIFSTSFTGAATTLLTATTPDIGTSWTNEGGRFFELTGAGGVNANVTGQPQTIVAVANPVAATPNDQSARVEMYTDSTNQLLGVISRFVDINNFYLLRINPFEANELQLLKIVAGAETVLGSANATASGTFDLKIQAIGTALKGFLGGSEVISVTDSAFAGGKTGIYDLAFTNETNPNYRFDSFVARDEAAGGGSSFLSLAGVLL